jgi:putative FmdB family regulatory protein
MPLYEYYCPPCGIQFELLRPMSQMDEVAVCPSGHTTNNRILSLFAPIMKGAHEHAEGGVMTDMHGGIDACCMGDGADACSCC